MISTFTGWSISNYGAYIDLPHQEVMKWQLQNWFTSGTGSGGSAILLIDPVVAKDLQELQSFDSKEKLAEWLAQNATTPAWHYWARGANQLKQAKEGVEPFAEWLKLGDMASLPTSPFMRRFPKTASGQKSKPKAAVPADSRRSPVEIVVVGGETNPYWIGGDFSYVSSASVDRWR